jgi:hypothetical protein
MEGISIWCWWAAPFWTPIEIARRGLREGMRGKMMRGRRAERHAPFIV